MIEHVNCTTTSILRKVAFLPNPGIIPFKAIAGLNDDKVNAG